MTNILPVDDLSSFAGAKASTPFTVELSPCWVMWVFYRMGANKIIQKASMGSLGTLRNMIVYNVNAMHVYSVNAMHV